MEKITGKLLIEKNFTISCAESCTGGLLTSTLTDAAGSSNYVKGAIVSYTNEIKNSILKVKAETLEKFSAVSEETAREMAENVREIFKTDIGVGITGYAGPGGGTKNNPVGTVYISFAEKNFVEVKKFQFSGSRTEIKFQAVQSALKIIQDNLLK